MVEPQLEGSKIDDFTMERVSNVLGGLDLLRFEVPPLTMTLFLDTDIVLELPNGIAYDPDYYQDELVCRRELASGELVQIAC